MEKCCQDAAKAYGASCEFIHEPAYPTLSLDLDCDLVKETVKAMEAEEIRPDLQVIGGGNDANVLAGHGYRSVILGLGMRNVHTVEESLDINEVWKAARVMRRMMDGE